MNKILPILLVLFISGCVLYPTKRLIYEPEAEIGRLENSEACGHMFSKDLWVIENEEYKLEIKANTKTDNGNLSLFLYFAPASQSVTIDFNKIILTTDNNDKFKPVNIIRHRYLTPIGESEIIAKSDSLKINTKKFYTIEFEASPDDVQEFRLSFDEGAILSTDHNIDIPTIKFNKANKSDLYYGSINC